MKKIIVFLLSFVILFALAGCNLGGDDNLPPVIVLTGDATITLTVGDVYNEPGYTALDDNDGDISTLVQTSGSVNTSVAGTYTITYTVTDSEGASASPVVRTIIVEEENIQLSTAESIVANFNSTGSIEYLNTTMDNLDFSQAMKLTADFYMEITEDINEIHYIDATVVDSYVFAVGANKVMREISVDVDGNNIEFTIILVEVATGVHVYVEYGPVMTFIAQQEPEVADMMSWIGFENQWALFEFDDSIQNLIQIEVLKEMLVSLFFSEMGETFFYDAQVMLEDEIGFDLDQYGVNLGLFIDYLIEEDFVSAEALLQNIDIDGIILHADYMYLAPGIYEMVYSMGFDTALSDAGFPLAKLEVLNTAHYDEILDEIVLDVDPIDLLHGTEYFFNSLTETELDTFIDVVIKPIIESMVGNAIMSDFDFEWLDSELQQIMINHQFYLETNWPTTFVLADEIAAIQSMGSYNYYWSLTDSERWTLNDAAYEYDYDWVVWQMDYITSYTEYYNWWDPFGPNYIDPHYYDNEMIEFVNQNFGFLEYEYGLDPNSIISIIQVYGAIVWWNDYTNDWTKEAFFEASYQPNYEAEVLWNIEELMYRQQDIADLIQTHSVLLTDLGYDPTAMLTDLNTNGIQVFMETIPAEFLGDILEVTLYPLLEGLHTAIVDGEIPEYLMEVIFTDPHVLALLNSGEYFPFDETIIASNMLAVDFDALALEVVDLQGLAAAIYGGQITFDAYLDALSFTAPNAALIIEIWAPAVYEMEVVFDDINYAFTGLATFDHYFDIEYWMDGNMGDVTAVSTVDDMVLTTLELDPISYQLLVSDIAADVYAYLDGFTLFTLPYDENWDCLDPLDTYCEPIGDQLTQLNAILTQMGNSEFTMLYDPEDPSWMQLNLDFSDFLDVLVDMQYQNYLDNYPDYVPNEYDDIWTGVNDFSLTMTVDTDATIALPTTVDNVNSIINEFGKFGVSMFARDFLREVEWFFEYNPDHLASFTAGTYTLDELDYMIDLSAAFDPYLSTITVTDPQGDMQLSLVLYWIDGTEALNGSVSLADFQSNFDEYNDIINETAYDTMLGYVNATNFNTTKLFLMLLMQE